MKDTAAVYIATTQGPVGIMRLTMEPRLKLSIASIGLDTKKSSISDAYHDFVSLDTGVIARHTQNETYRLHLQRDIEQGDSWKLGVYLAHQLFDQQRLVDLCSTEAQLSSAKSSVILTTGAVNIDGDVLPVAEIPRKLETAERLMQGAYDAGVPVYFFLPQRNLTADLKAILESFQERYPNLEFFGLSHVTFDALPGIPETARCGNLAPTQLLKPEVPKSSTTPKKQILSSAKHLFTWFQATKFPKIYTAILITAALSPLAILSAMNITKPANSTESQTRIRLLTSATHRCFGTLGEESWRVLTWNEENSIHGIERICQLEIHTENTSLRDQIIKIYSGQKLIKTGVMSATSAASILIPVYQLRDQQLTLRLSDESGLEAYATVDFQ